MAETYLTVLYIFGFLHVRLVSTLDIRQRTQRGQHGDDREVPAGSEREVLVKCLNIRDDICNM